MKLRDRIIFSLVALAAFCWMIYLVRSILAPFIFSLIIAYFLDPLVDRLTNKYKLSRLIATLLIVGLFIISLIGGATILLPIIFTQFSAFISAIPEYFQIIVKDFYPLIAGELNKIGFELQTDFSHLAQNPQFSSRFVDFSQNILNNAVSSSITLINVLSLIFITPILIFYLLKDWDVFTKKIKDYLPQKIALPAQEIASEINKTLSGYVRGQFHVCIILGFIYSIMLSFTGVNFGFLIGFFTGLFSFIPFVGMLCGVVVAIIVALFQWGFDLTHIAAISVVFIFGQLIESNFLTPKLIGSKIGLHPVWIIFGLFIFGTLFGFVGVLIAVPLTAVCGVIIKYFASKYKKRFVA